MSSSEKALQRLFVHEKVAIGVSAGVLDITLTQWMIYGKNAAQQRIAFSFDPKVLYRGYSMSTTNMCVLYGLQFPLTGMVTHMITQGKERRLSGSEQLLAGFLGGAMSGFVCAPMELVMIQQQKFGTSLVGTAIRIVQKSGMTGMFRGLLMSCGREGAFAAGTLGIMPTIKRYAVEELGMSQSTGSMAGALCGGIVVGTLSHPLDTIKTCQQGDLMHSQYKGVVHTTRALTSEAGVRRFFSGWSWRTGRMVIQTLLFDITVSKLSPVLFPRHFE